MGHFIPPKSTQGNGGRGRMWNKEQAMTLSYAKAVSTDSGTEPQLPPGLCTGAGDE